MLAAAVTLGALGVAITIRGHVTHGGFTLPVPPRSGEAAAGAPPNASDLAGSAEPAVVYIVAALPPDPATTSATGLVVSDTGLVVTNAHVIEDSTSVHVVDPLGIVTYDASVVGYDEAADIAVLQVVGAPRLAVITTGDPAQVHSGDGVVAVGNAVGNAGGRAGTPGYVSGRITGLDKSIVVADLISQTAGTLGGLIETNAPVVSGNSGGALVDCSGKVIGMIAAGNAEFVVRREAARGYAIPIDRVMRVARSIAPALRK